MSQLEFNKCMDDDGYLTCVNLEKFEQFSYSKVIEESVTVASSISTTATTFLSSTLITSSLPTTLAPSISSCDLSDLKAYIKKEGYILVKKVVKSTSGELGDLSKKTLDSVVESEGFSRFIQAVVEGLPVGLGCITIKNGIITKALNVVEVVLEYSPKPLLVR